MLDAESFTCRLSCSISSHFIAIHICSVRCSQKMRQICQNLFGGSRLFKVIDVDRTKKAVSSACYDMQHVCTHLQPFYTRQ